VKSENRPARHADAVVRHYAEHQRAGRQAWPVNYDAFARFPHPIEQIEKRAHLSARTAEDAQLGLRRHGKSA
jgi:hypothetical protein